MMDVQLFGWLLRLANALFVRFRCRPTIVMIPLLCGLAAKYGMKGETSTRIHMWRRFTEMTVCLTLTPLTDYIFYPYRALINTHDTSAQAR